MDDGLWSLSRPCAANHCHCLGATCPNLCVVNMERTRKGHEHEWHLSYWPKNRIETREGMQPKLDNPALVEPLHRRDISTLGWAAYFSLLSTFQIGFREFNVGTWLSRAQPRNFVLEAVGWVRTVSGLQSLLSVYLLAMWLLTYFGRPFQ